MNGDCQAPMGVVLKQPHTHWRRHRAARTPDHEEAGAGPVAARPLAELEVMPRS